MMTLLLIKRTMNLFEKYVANVDINDENCIKDIKICQGVCYRGKYNLIRKHEKVCKCHPPNLASAVLGLENTDIPVPDHLEFYNAWTDMDAQEAYLKTKPTSYLILSKPGVGSYTLGEALSKKINCVHICPKNVLTDEVDQRSATGHCLDYNMKLNKVCQIDNILPIMKKKLESPAIKHRGYVISGIPLISFDRNLLTFFKSLHGEESIQVVEGLLYDLIYNLKKKKSKVQKGSLPSSITSGIGVGEEIDAEEEEEEHEPEQEEAEEPRVELPKHILDACSDMVSYKKPFFKIMRATILEQIEEIFHFKPDIIIHITCPNNDVITKRSHKYFNYITSANNFNPFIMTPDNELKWPSKYNLRDYNRSFDSHVFNPKYNCKHPCNFSINIKKQICNFEDHLYEYLEDKIKTYDPKHIINLDGRVSIHHMMHNILERLTLLPIKPILFPEPLYLEEPPEDMQEFWKTVEELNVVRTQNVNFNRYSSPWYNRCPVKLKKRRSVQGNPRFAVSFFKHVYLLSSLDNMISFCRNPRPYLKLKYLEPTCRIIVLGTKCSGKTLVTNCLSWLFDSTVICYLEILKKEKQKKYNAYAKNILSEIIATIEDNRFIKWENSEIQRISDLNMWYNTNYNILNRYIQVFQEVLKQKEEDAGINGPLLKKLKNLRVKLSSLPFMDDIELCQDAVQGDNLKKYTPPDLLIVTEKPKIPVLGDEDVTTAISEYIKTNDLQKEIEPTCEEIMKEIINHLKALDDDNLCQNYEPCYGRFIIDGFPPEAEYWEYLTEADMLPDYTVAIIENREVDDELLQHYNEIEKSVKNYQERYLNSNDTLVKTKLLRGIPVNSTYLNIKTIVDEFIENVFNTMFTEEMPMEDIVIPDLRTLLTEGIEKFRESWEQMKAKLDNQSKWYGEIELDGKSDIDVIDEVLLQLRKAYCNFCIVNEDKVSHDHEYENEIGLDLLSYNDDRNLSDTNIFCPVAFFNYNVLWEGKPEISAKYNNKLIMFSKDECLEQFQKDSTKYQSLIKPFKKMPCLRICTIGNIGSGKSNLSKRLAKESGLLHVNFDEFINNYVIPKHFNKVGWQYENSFKDGETEVENAVEFQMNEENANISDLLFNETEIKRIVSNYFEQGVAMPSLLLQQILKTLWFEEPYKSIGIVIDGFPKLPSDVEDMVSSYCIPNVVLVLETSSEKAIERISPIMLKMWKNQYKEAKLEAQIHLEDEKREWFNFIAKKTVIKLIVDEIVDSVIPDNIEHLQNPSMQSTIFDANPLGSSNVDVNLFSTYNNVIQEHPAPVDQSEWEKSEDVLERINERIEAIYEVSEENIQSTMEILSEQRIQVVTINGQKSVEKVFRNAIDKLSTLFKRNESFLEQTFIINCDIADMLIYEGFFFLSKFNRMCPVYLYENPFTLYNPYYIKKRKGSIFPIIHRAYIYFISSEDNVKKFRSNALKYIKSRHIESHVEYPLRIAIIGPPKSGKSTLATKLAKQFGLLCISRGSCVRYIMENMRWTELSSKMISSLQTGSTINSENIIKCIQTIAIDHRTVSYGIIFDGYPETAFESTELVKHGLYPLIIFDLKTSLPKACENSEKEIHFDILKIKPPFSKAFVEYRYHQWENNCSSVRKWIHDDIQNLYELYADGTSWQCFHIALKVIDEISKKVYDYLSNYESKIVRANVMAISNEIFKSKMSGFKNFCPMCFMMKIYKSSDHPVDKSGVVQYRDIYYWICRNHIKDLHKLTKIVSTHSEIEFPEIPAVVKTINPSLVYENGVCIVTYAENLPSQSITKGSNNFAAIYRGRYYLFCSSKCLECFIQKPHMYFEVQVFKDACGFPEISLKSLPNLGYLEQTMGNLITAACCAVNVFRPKYFGLDISLSGVIYIALYLKTHNSRTDQSQLKLYKQAFKIYEARCKLAVDVGLTLRSIDNPFADYVKCYDRIKNITESNSGTVEKPSSYESSETEIWK